MKRTKTIEVDICDVCGEHEASYYGCQECGIKVCYDCKDKTIVEMQYSLNFSGSYDGKYCKDCIAKLDIEPTPLYSAYKRIAEIKDEWNAFWKELKTEADQTTEFIERNRKRD